MSKAKFLVAKELIDEKNYDLARSLLETMESPLADQWLEKLDRIDTSRAQRARQKFETEQEKFYRQQNRDRKRVRTGRGVDMILFSIGVFIVGVFLLYMDGSDRSLSCLSLCPFPMALLAFLVGVKWLTTD